MSAPATTREAVDTSTARAERMAATFGEENPVRLMLLALAAARDALLERAEKAEAERDAERERGREISVRHATLWRHYIECAHKRDAALAKAGRMREALEATEAEVRARIGGQDWEGGARWMELDRRARDLRRAALGEDGDER